MLTIGTFRPATLSRRSFQVKGLGKEGYTVCISPTQDYCRRPNPDRFVQHLIPIGSLDLKRPGRGRGRGVASMKRGGCMRTINAERAPVFHDDGWRGFNDFNKKECKRTSDPAIMRITHPSLDCCRRGNGGMRKGWRVGPPQ